jgi:hypothetical protein
MSGSVRAQNLQDLLVALVQHQCSGAGAGAGAGASVEVEADEADDAELTPSAGDGDGDEDKNEDDVSPSEPLTEPLLSRNTLVRDNSDNSGLPNQDRKLEGVQKTLFGEKEKEEADRVGSGLYTASRIGSDFYTASESSALETWSEYDSFARDGDGTDGIDGTDGGGGNGGNGCERNMTGHLPGHHMMSSSMNLDSSTSLPASSFGHLSSSSGEDENESQCVHQYQ